MQINYVLVNIIIAMKRTCAFYICQNTQNHNETSNFACGKFK
ncbi:transposase, partial [Lactobacillus crispatus]